MGETFSLSFSLPNEVPLVPKLH